MNDLIIPAAIVLFFVIAHVASLWCAGQLQRDTTRTPEKGGRS